MDEWIKWLIGGLGALLVSAYTWIFANTIGRVRRLEDGKANKKSTDDRFDRVLSEIDEHRKEDRDIHTKLFSESQRANETLARIEGALTANLKVDK